MNPFSETVVEKTGRKSAADKTTAVVVAVLMPHAPILVPVVGGERGGEAEASCRAEVPCRAELCFRAETCFRSNARS